MPKLVGRIADTLHEFPLTAATTVIGRDPSCTIPLELPHISREHCRIDRDPDGSLRLVDLASTNGTSLNGHLISRVDLELGDRLRLGEMEFVLANDHEDPRAALSRPPRRWAEAQDHATWCFAKLGPKRDSQRAVAEQRILDLTQTGLSAVAEGDVTVLLGDMLRELSAFTGAAWTTLLLQPPGGDALEPLDPDHHHGTPWDDPTLQDLVRDAVAAHATTERTLPLAGDPRRALVLPFDRADASAPAGLVERRPRTGGALLLLWDDAPDPDKPETDASDRRAIVELVATQAALLLQHVWLFRQASVDHLTQLSNRARIERLLDAEFDNARANGTPLTLVLFDLDHFKRINDTHGHPVGDDVLREVSRRARAALRQGDPIGRWGGEEFLLVLPRCDVRGAEHVTTKIAHTIRSTPIAEPRLRVTLSAGIASYPLHAASPDDLIRRADLALYAAKEGGRDRHMVFTYALEEQPEDQDRTLLELEAVSRWIEDTSEPEPDDEVISTPVLECVPFPPVPLRGDRITIGREAVCDLTLPHQEISRLHAVVLQRKGIWFVEDQGSVNGTYLNGLRLKQPTVLRPGDRLRIDPYTVVVRDDREEYSSETRYRTEVRDLHETPLAKLLWELHDGERSLTLEVVAGVAQGYLQLSGGRLVAAQCGDLLGEDALRALLAFEAGTCFLYPSHKPLKGPIERPLHDLLEPPTHP